MDQKCTRVGCPFVWRALVSPLSHSVACSNDGNWMSAFMFVIRLLHRGFVSKRGMSSLCNLCVLCVYRQVRHNNYRNTKFAQSILKSYWASLFVLPVASAESALP